MRSTGPRTDAGKARAAGNSLQHGLSVPISALPEVDAKVTRLAQLIAGPDADESRLDLARRIAEAQVDLERVRAVRLLFLSGSTLDVSHTASKDSMALIRLAKRVFDGDVNSYPAIRALQDKIYSPPDARSGPESVAAGIVGGAQQLTRLDRYERRALSRRKLAARAWDDSNATST